VTIEGFWTVDFRSDRGSGSGVAVFANAKIFGGDNGFTWIGAFEVNGGIVQARLRIHNFNSEIESLLKTLDDYDLDFVGSVSGDVITGTAAVSGQPHLQLSLHLAKRADL